MINRPILRNAIQTPDGTILESFHVHDYKTHKDSITGEEFMVDGGHDYLRRNVYDCKDLTIIDDGKHITRRNSMSWGRNIDKEGNVLRETQYILIKDMEQEHIEKILQLYAERLPKVYLEAFLDEITWREEEIIKELELQN